MLLSFSFSPWRHAASPSNAVSTADGDLLFVVYGGGNLILKVFWGYLHALRDLHGEKMYVTII